MFKKLLLAVMLVFMVSTAMAQPVTEPIDRTGYESPPPSWYPVAPCEWCEDIWDQSTWDDPEITSLLFFSSEGGGYRKVTVRHTGTTRWSTIRFYRDASRGPIGGVYIQPGGILGIECFLIVNCGQDSAYTDW